MLRLLAREIKDTGFYFEPKLTGSVAEGTKVGKCDEFDFLCVFKDFNVTIDPENPMHCKVQPPETLAHKLRHVCDYAGRIDALKFTSTFAEILENNVNNSAYQDSNNWKSYINVLFNRRTKPYEKYGLSCLSIDKSGRFPKIVAEISQGNLKGIAISVDLVPVFLFREI